MSAEERTIGAPAVPASRLAAFWHSWIGKKALMAVTGLALLAFVLVHMLANLQAFQGALALDRYAEQLRVFPALLWTVRVLLAVSALVHVIAGAQLWAVRGRAREVPYRDHRPGDSTPASRT